jgi:hypothetical protein
LTAPKLPVAPFSNASAAAGKNFGPTVTLSKTGNPAPAASKQLADLTALLFASEAPDLATMHAPAQPTASSTFVSPAKISVYPVPTAIRAAWTGAFGGIAPDAARIGDGYKVLFLPASSPEKSLSFQTTEGQAYHGEVVTVTLPSDAKSGAHYRATIDWGDGSGATTGSIHISGKQAAVDGQHLYMHPGRYTVQVHIEAGGASIGDMTGTATVVPATPPGTGPAPSRNRSLPKTKPGPQSRRSSHAEGWPLLSVAVGLISSRPALGRRRAHPAL